MTNNSDTSTPTFFERLLSILQAAFCIAITLTAWISVGRYQETWPLPAAYFLELMAGSCAIAFLFLLSQARASLAAWFFSGLVTSFIILAGFSIGFAYVPVLLVLISLVLYSDIRHKRLVLPGLGLWLLGGLVQTGIILAVIRFSFIKLAS